MNGFGEHNIQGIGDKHVPLIHNVMNTDVVIGVSDHATDTLLTLFNTDEGKRYLVERRGVDPSFVTALQNFGISSICNIVAAVKFAKYFDLGPDDVVLTVATDGAEMYMKRSAQGAAALLRQPLRCGRRGRDLGPAHGRRGRRSRSRAQSRRSQAAVQPWLFHLGRAARRLPRRLHGARQTIVLGWLARSRAGLGRDDREIQCGERRRRQARVTEVYETPFFVCHGCGAVVDPARAFPFACPNARAGGDVDHVLVAPSDTRGLELGDDINPFLRYRRWLTPYQLARAKKLSDAAWTELVGELDIALERVDGRGFRLTPMARQPALAAALGFPADLWIKDETGNVGGSHKARHLMGVMLYLRVLEKSGSALSEGLRKRPLAIASCGNAALAAAVIARAANWPLEVFIPPDAEPAVVRRLSELGAAVQVCERAAGQTGDPCVHAARKAVGDGAIPFSVQGPDNGLAVEGARTLAFEMAETLGAEGTEDCALYVQVGGGAFASALAQGFGLAVAAGLMRRAPRLIAVQTLGCAPLARLGTHGRRGLRASCGRKIALHVAVGKRPASLAHGILDDETYDWLEVVKAMRVTGGEVLVAGEDAVARAFRLAGEKTAIPVSATGSAGLAGALVAPCAHGAAAAVFSGVERFP